MFDFTAVEQLEDNFPQTTRDIWVGEDVQPAEKCSAAL